MAGESQAPCTLSFVGLCVKISQLKHPVRYLKGRSGFPNTDFLLYRLMNPYMDLREVFGTNISIRPASISLQEKVCRNNRQ